MPRILRVHCPIVRMTVGNSFGPITTSATTPMSRNSVQLMSHIKKLYGRIPALFAAPADQGCNLMAPNAPASSGTAPALRALDLALGLGAPLEVGGSRL